MSGAVPKQQQITACLKLESCFYDFSSGWVHLRCMGLRPVVASTGRESMQLLVAASPRQEAHFLLTAFRVASSGTYQPGIETR